MMPEFSYVRPKSLKEAIEHSSSEGARLHAGGTDLLGCLRDGVFPARTVVSLTGLSQMAGIRATEDGGVRIGALTSIAETARSPMILERYRALAQAAGDVASPQLRNQGTLGGNLCQRPRCWYYRSEFHCLRKGGDMCYAVGGESHFHCILGGERCFIVHPSDTAPALVAMEARVRLAGPKGERDVAVEQFFVLPSRDVERETVLESGEILVEISLPPPPSGLRSSYRKVRARRSWDFALAGVALALTFEGELVVRARIVLSGAAPIPWRSQEAEEAIVGRRLDRESAVRAAQAAMRDARPLAHNDYKVPLFRGLIEEELLAIASLRPSRSG
jgi:xanthine dehydrogenase YagS FAD-binding subunit